MADNDTKSKSMTKSAIYAELSEKTELSRKQIASVFDTLTNELIKRELGKKGPGIFVMPGLLKLKRIRKDATKKQVKANPFKPGEMMEVKAKPARNIIKAQCLKSLKEMVK